MVILNSIIEFISADKIISVIIERLHKLPESLSTTEHSFLERNEACFI
jgi:hypothetical protein